jgi:anti-anti-sigma regulatory factor
LEGKLKDTGDPGKPWNINVEWQRWAVKTNVVKVTGDLRGDGAGSLRRTLAGELTGTPELLVLDLSDIEQIDLDGIDTLDVAAELAAEDDVRFCLVLPPKGIHRHCLNVVELSKRFQTFSSVNEAVQHHHERLAGHSNGLSPNIR